MRLAARFIDKPWGKTVLPTPFGRECDAPVGEAWFEAPDADAAPLEILVKYLFTSEKLSVQVHPNDRQARRRDFPHGKEECWYVLDAEPDARIGLGLTKEVRKAKLRAAATTGAIESLVDWKPVKAGDFFYVPPGTIHAIGGGLSLVEVQQNSDITYRLYDYGRPRELHLDDGIAVAALGPYDMVNHDHIPTDRPALLMDGPKFRLFQILGSDDALLQDCAASEWQIIPLEGSTRVDGVAVEPGAIGIATSRDAIDLSDNGRCLIATNME